MKRLSKDEIEAAKQIDLLTYMQRYEPDELIRVGPHDFKTKTHSSLCISDNGFWNWTSRGFGGKNALKYLLEVKQMPFPDAVRLLNEEREINYSFQQARPIVPDRSKEQKVLVLPKKDEEPKEVIAYLKKRGISQAVMQYCLSHDLLYQTTNKGHPNCVFVGLDERNRPKAACIRGCSGSFRGEVTGSQKQFSFHIPANDPNCMLLEVYEAPIDAMSGATLRQYSGRDWHNVSYLSLGGLNYIALDHYLEQHPEIKKLRVCLDNDEPGRVFTDKLLEKYRHRGYTVEDKPARVGKDYNEALLAYCTRMKTKRHTTEKWR